MNRDRGVDQEKQQSSESAVHYDELNQLPPAQFRRWCGVDRHTFHAMVEVLRPSLERQGKRGGQNRLSVENQLVLTFQYWREYRTQFHIALDFGVSEATVCRTIAKVENILVRSGQFRLPSKRQLLDPDDKTDVALVDVTEVPVERPQKNSRTSTAARNDNTL